MKNLHISVKDMVKFIHSGGDLTSEFKSNKRAIDGIDAHAFLQNSYSINDKKEVAVKTIYDIGDYSLHIAGRMDGLRVIDNVLAVEEIKSTTTDLELIDITTRPEHLAQAKLYAYLYCLQENIKSISVRLVYVTLKDYNTKVFVKRYNFTQLRKFFEKTIKQYVDWLDIVESHRLNKLRSIEGLNFPFNEYREGQYSFMGAIYKTIISHDILFSIAPTGIGKTIGALFSALKSIKNEREKVFYLTAKNAGKTIAIDTVNLLKENGLTAKTVVLYSKEEMCLMDKVDCDPDICPYAKGYFSRVNKALEDIFVHQDIYDKNLIKSYGEYHTICPHEFSLDISYFSDIVICDYNYAFDPRVHLIRYFDEEYYSPILLVDEAHNMIDRSKSMYSSTLSLMGILALQKVTTKLKPSVRGKIQKVIMHIEEFTKKIDLEKSQFYYQMALDEEIIVLLESVRSRLEQILIENKKFSTRKQVLDGYFMCNQFLKISEYYGANYRYIVEKQNGDVKISLSCLDASSYINEIINRRSQGTVFFSATLEPIDYHVRLITKGNGKSISIPSPFPIDNLGIFIDSRTSTRYRDRKNSISAIIDDIYIMADTKVGNYICFFPSYKYLEDTLEQFDSTNYDVQVQKRNQSVNDKLTILSSFDTIGKRSKIGFFVLGGSFSEGIDYIGEKLYGVMVVGVGMPQYNKSNEILRAYFDDQFGEGFDYAYTYPGMNKVIQAAGRVIRTRLDKGIVILFDDRYSHQKYRKLFPNNWTNAVTVRISSHLKKKINHFWNKHSISKNELK
jgi:DNA excision repair protein ERCC-2